MADKRMPLYERLPEIYRIKDEEQSPPGQLQAYLGLVEEVFGAVHENIESLYHDLFIETCDDWVIPYIADLLGTSHLAGDPWTLRADVADTIALRRRKGTIGSIELLTFNLTKWGVHCVELRENLAWHQHLNHQRPDAGGAPPYGLPGATMRTVVRGGYVTLRDPAMLSLLGTPYDPFAYYPDVRPAGIGTIRYNLPNLAIFLWRLTPYRLKTTVPVHRGTIASAAPLPAEANFAVRFDLDPLSRPVRLFNTPRYDPDLQPPVVSLIDESPGPMPPARLSSNSEAGNPSAYVSFETYDATTASLASVDFADVGLQFHLPDAQFAGAAWTVRGANLCAWEAAIHPPLNNREVAVDPVIGRALFGVDTLAEANALEDALLATYAYGAVGEVGAHPITRSPAPATWNGEAVTFIPVNFRDNPTGLQDALDNIQNSNVPILIEIADNNVHDLDLAAVAGHLDEMDGLNLRPNLRINRTLIIRAASGNRPVIRLASALRFRPTNVVSGDADEQQEFDSIISNITVRLEGLFLTRAPGFPVDEPLIARTAVHRLEVLGCTLDPGGYLEYNGTTAPIQTSMRLPAPYGFTTDPAEETAFKETPEIVVQRSITGPLLIDTGYLLFLTDSIVDAGKGVAADSTNSFAVSGATDAVDGWGPPTQIGGITVFGRMRVESINGRGGIWVHRLEVSNNQKGCIKFSYFSGDNDRLPQNFACVRGPARLRFTSEVFGQPAYGQLAFGSDFQIRERGPNDDAMGAFGFLMEAHKWRNLQIRFREFMPVGVRPLLIPVT